MLYYKTLHIYPGRSPNQLKVLKFNGESITLIIPFIIVNCCMVMIGRCEWG